MRQNREILLSVGMLSLVVAIFLRRFVGQGPVVSFVEGVLLGLSMVLNLVYLVRLRSGKKTRR